MGLAVVIEETEGWKNLSCRAGVFPFITAAHRPYSPEDTCIDIEGL